MSSTADPEPGVLISAGALFELLRRDSDRPAVLDVRWQLGGRPGREEYAEGHIPGAVFVDLDTELSGPPGSNGRHPLPQPGVFTDAMRAAPVAEGGKRWAVIGDIFELGPFARAEHHASGVALAGNVDYLVALGDKARFYVEGALEAGMPEKNAYYFSADVENADELEAAKRAVADLLIHEVHGGDLVLIKGSRGMRMETILDML